MRRDVSQGFNVLKSVPVSLICARGWHRRHPSRLRGVRRHVAAQGLPPHRHPLRQARQKLLLRTLPSCYAGLLAGRLSPDPRTSPLTLGGAGRGRSPAANAIPCRSPLLRLVFNGWASQLFIFSLRQAPPPALQFFFLFGFFRALAFRTLKAIIGPTGHRSSAVLCRRAARLTLSPARLWRTGSEAQQRCGWMAIYRDFKTTVSTGVRAFFRSRFGRNGGTGGSERIGHAATTGAGSCSLRVGSPCRRVHASRQPFGRGRGDRFHWTIRPTSGIAWRFFGILISGPCDFAKECGK